MAFAWPLRPSPQSRNPVTEFLLLHGLTRGDDAVAAALATARGELARWARMPQMAPFDAEARECLAGLVRPRRSPQPDIARSSRRAGRAAWRHDPPSFLPTAGGL
ncbi:hypothetical protein Tamer19_68130 [Cupriavidus sp. TA19]|nr:hypothetical protein Tamer19_68130 [Cupriavidus sp. TA19]